MDGIDAGVGVVQLFSKVAFKNDKRASTEIDTAATSLGTMSSNIVKLATPGALANTGAQILAGVGIANAALSIISLFGPSGQDATARMI